MEKRQFQLRMPSELIPITIKKYSDNHQENIARNKENVQRHRDHYGPLLSQACSHAAEVHVEIKGGECTGLIHVYGEPDNLEQFHQRIHDLLHPERGDR